MNSTLTWDGWPLMHDRCEQWKHHHHQYAITIERLYFMSNKSPPNPLPMYQYLVLIAVSFQPSKECNVWMGRTRTQTWYMITENWICLNSFFSTLDLKRPLVKSGTGPLNYRDWIKNLAQSMISRGELQYGAEQKKILRPEENIETWPNPKKGPETKATKGPRLILIP